MGLGFEICGDTNDSHPSRMCLSEVLDDVGKAIWGALIWLGGPSLCSREVL